eukprot:gnl/MRDRNA2_/MRDRNA2_135285_c0_seq1.p1 gnl/MRDRNA2_/MRDRNA2_135285_c0~~gnl/MRDRNA2_/MRDRNA2_135285_c0_seq1.p1  ORF type:complete len:553 (+),score=86.10 gnl/MRDRNA2_/MRDRNA2_135285_c0_seq1:89-1747(+)
MRGGGRNHRIGGLLKKHGYVEVRKVGEGSFGQAILVEYEQDKSKLICKMVDLSHASGKETQDALKESRLLSSLRHPYVVRYRESFFEDGWLCILMDFCEGGDLTAKIEASKKGRHVIPEEQILRWLTQALLALKYIHDKHVLHRDLKSSNFFITKSGNLKVGDFGIAKVLSCTAACAKTQIGTPYYLSPEVCQEKPYSWGSDIWAMGCVLFELCALRVPFDAPNLSSLVQKICRGPTPTVPSTYSEGVRQLCTEMLQRNPDRRPSAGDILQKPLIQAVVRKLLDEAQQEEGSKASQPLEGKIDRPIEQPQNGVRAPSPARVDGSEKEPYRETAGQFKRGDRVEYYSETHKEWLPATVTSNDAEGRICIDLKPNSWLSLDIQATRVRPRAQQPPARTPSVHGGAVATPMRHNSPSWRSPSPVGMRAGTPGRYRDHSPGFPPSRGGTPMRRQSRDHSAGPPGLPHSRGGTPVRSASPRGPWVHRNNEPSAAGGGTPQISPGARPPGMPLPRAPNSPQIGADGAYGAQHREPSKERNVPGAIARQAGMAIIGPGQ